MTHLSYISAVYNKAQYLPQLLQNLRDQTGIAEDVEFVFADDASTDASVTILDDAAKSDPRIRVLHNQENRGPAIRFNQAAQAAQGEWLLPVDPDDRLSPNAAASFLRVAADTGADLVFARNKRGKEPQPLPNDLQISVSDTPLLMAATRKIVRMGYLARTETWHAARGADEKVFIQDQSLPLRLGHEARIAAYIDDVAYWLSTADSQNLSQNKMQQHHDRYATMAHMLARPDIPDDARRAIEGQMISACVKARRSGAKGFSFAWPAYLLNRALGRSMSPAQQTRARMAFDALPNIRRP